ncbi:hypothetical protein AB0M02_00420 [Actinoplanes sp. NPDC051861]|uniref:hypothetical protein n=1 Tax=Actinoplanes sp. NPDC051861 TaxID=3155170 RepID=UPI00342A952F
MPRYLLGQGVNLQHTVYNRDGQLTAADVVFTATDEDGGDVVPSVTTPSTGLYRAATFLPAVTGPWTYVVAVTGAVNDVAYGAFTVVDGSTLTTPPTGAYASQADLAGVLTPLPDNADQLLVRAALQIDRALLTSVYDTTDTGVIAALRQATLEQILGDQQDGDTTGLGGVTQTATNFSIGKISVQKAATTSTPVPRVGGLVEQAWLTLQAAGLTGGGPGERWVNW